MIPLYCTFPDEATALVVATALRDAALPEDVDPATLPEVTEFPKDGWLNGIYYNIDVVFGTGQIYRETGETIQVDDTLVPVTELVPGYHINGLWHGPLDTIPVAISQFLVYPEKPVCVFG